MNSLPCLVLAFVVSLTVCPTQSVASSSSAGTVAIPVDQVASPVSGDSGKCPLRAAALDKLTPYRWKVGQYKADQAFIPNGSIRIDYCELIGMDAKGQMKTGLMVNIARGANADAFAKHWRAACADSIMADARGKVQPVRGVSGGQQCVTANGSSSLYWIESPGYTIQLEPETDGAPWAEILPQLLAATAQ